MSGTFGVFGVLSFNGNKIITTSGGGMLLSDNKALIGDALKKATQSKEKAAHYQHETVGYNYRMSNVCAGIGRGQMEVLEKRIEQKRAIFDKYVEELGDINGIEFMPEMEDAYHTRWLSTLVMDPKKIEVTPGEVIEYLEDHNIEARAVWKPLHMQPLYKDAMYFSAEGDNAKYLFENGICLPSDTKMTEEEMDRVTTLLREHLHACRIRA